MPETTIVLDMGKSVEANASAFFQLAKGHSARAEKIRAAIADAEKKIRSLEKKRPEAGKRKALAKRERNWYERFHWFFTSENLLVIAGRDRHSNEAVIKKHMD